VSDNWSCCPGLSGLGVAGEPPGHDGDHGPLDHRLVVFGEPFVVTDGAAELGDPGEGALDHPAARQYLEGVQVIWALDELNGDPQRSGRPDDQLPGVAAVSPDQADAPAGPVQSCARSPRIWAGRCT
jgi:hypothetical protein